MDINEFKLKVKELEEKDCNTIKYSTDNIIDNVIAPNVRYYVDGIRGYVTFADALKFYNETEQNLQTDGKFWKQQFIKYLRTKTCLGYGDLNNYVNQFIDALKMKPIHIMDKPSKLEINWK